MKKHLKKLTLNRETLRKLSNRDIEGVFGAVSNTSCACRMASGCDCETGGCTITCPIRCDTIDCTLNC
jgi:hypothetical protein